mgnify:CR=1 FL=1
MKLLRFENARWCFGADFDGNRVIAAAPAYWRIIGRVPSPEAAADRGRMKGFSVHVASVSGGDNNQQPRSET